MTRRSTRRRRACSSSARTATTDGRDYNTYGMGWMYRNTEMTAAFARSQLARLDWSNGVIWQNVHHFGDAVRDIKGMRLPVEFPERKHCFYEYKIRFSPRGPGALDGTGAVQAEGGEGSVRGGSAGGPLGVPDPAT